MAEEVKQEEKKVESSKGLSAALKYALAIVFLVLGVVAIIKWLGALLLVIKGCIGLFLILAGVITFAIAKE